MKSEVSKSNWSFLFHLAANEPENDCQKLAHCTLRQQKWQYWNYRLDRNADCDKYRLLLPTRAPTDTWIIDQESKYCGNLIQLNVIWRHQSRFLLFTPVLLKILFCISMTFNHLKTNCAKFVRYGFKSRKVIQFSTFSRTLMQHPL